MERTTQAGPCWVWGLIGCCALLSAVGCSSPDAPDYLYGHNLTEIEFELTDLAMGVYPDQSVLDDPNNPFRESSIGLDTRWDIHDHANDAAGFYSWATLLAKQPNGENQFYTGLKLRALSEGGELPAVHEPLVRDMAIAAFQAVLDHFPGSATYDVTGTIPYRLAPIAYRQIIELGGTVEGGWMLVPLDGGGTTVVQVDSDG